jgi:two-component system response regulator DesR
MLLKRDRDGDTAGGNGMAGKSRGLALMASDAPSARTIRVLVAENMHMIRAALVALLSLEDDIEVVADVHRGDAIVDTALRTQPDVAVIDIDLPGLDGLSAAAQLHHRMPTCQVLVLTGLTQPCHLLRAMKAHVMGFMFKEDPAATLAEGVRAVAAGRPVFAPELLAQAVATGDSPLTPREADVLQAAESGRPTDEIAGLLNLSPTTVRNYLSNAITKVGGRNRIEASRIARDAGWISSGPRIDPEPLIPPEFSRCSGTGCRAASSSTPA